MAVKKTKPKGKQKSVRSPKEPRDVDMNVDMIGSIVMCASAPLVERFREICNLENAANNILINCQLQRASVWKDIQEQGSLPEGFYYKVDLTSGAVMATGLKRDIDKGGM